MNDDDVNPYSSDANMVFKNMKDTVLLGKIYDSKASTSSSKITDERMQIKQKTKLMKALVASSTPISKFKTHLILGFNVTGFASRDKEATEEVYIYKNVVVY